MTRRISLVSIIFILVLMAILSCCSKGDNQQYQEETYNKFESQLVTENNAVVSPSGLYVLERIFAEVDDVSSFSFCIRDVKDNSVVFVSNDYYRLRDTTFLLWGEDDAVWVYSGDLGIFYWEKESDSWQKQTYADNIGDIEVPQALKELRPRCFD